MLKYTWVGLILFCVIGMLISVPVQKAQHNFQKALLKKKLAPQARLDATNKYLEEYENGNIENVYSFGVSPELKNLYGIELDKKVSENSEENSQLKIRRPLYIRDKNNSNILYKYTYTGEYTASAVKKLPYKSYVNAGSGVRRPLFMRDRKNPNIYYPVYP